MSTAKPQQSTGQSDGSDDLIAELARMMASDARPAQPAPAPEPEAAAPQEAKPAAGVRIPGPPENASSDEKFSFDFGAPPKAADSLHPTPLVNWQDRLSRPAEKPAEPVRQEPVIEPRPAAPRVDNPVVAEPVAQRAEPVVERPQAANPMPSFVAPARPVPEAPKAEAPRPESQRVEMPRAEAPRPEPIVAPPAQLSRAPEPTVSTEPAKSEPVAFTTHDFDFGFGTAKISEPVAEKAPVAPAPVEDSHDAIADLIAAELSDATPATPVEDHPAGDEGTSTVQSSTAEPEPAAKEPAPKPFLRAVNFTAQPKSQSDRFAVPPVFGVGSNAKPSQATPVAPTAPVAETRPAAPEAPMDPMDEIESLIGSSIRHEAAAKIETRGPSSPIPAARGPSPIPRATARPIRDDRGGAEAAILAAAAASGAEAGRVPPASGEERIKAAPIEAPAAKPRKAAFSSRSARPLIGLGAALALLVVAGGGLYWILGNNVGGGDGTAPVLTADASPVKEPPPANPTTTDTPPASVVLNELSGGNANPAAEQLVSRDQTGDTANVAAIAPTEVNGDEGLANRKVRTVTVRPDGTIVNADDALAGGQQLPVDRPNVPAVPNATLDNSDLLTAAANQPATTPAPLAGAQPSAQQPAAPAADAAATTIAPENVTPPGTVAPVPRPRMTNRQTAAIGPQPTNAVNAVVNDPIGALAAQATQPQTPAPATTSNSGTQAAAYVQLSSQRDEGVARQSLVDINQRYGKILGGVLPEVQRVDLGAKGVYYRVRVPTDSMQSANYLCSQIKSARGDCIVTN